MRPLLAVLCAAGCWTAVAAASDVAVNIAVAPGLKFNPARFAAAPGDHVRLILTNGDDMIHNLVVVAPGERLKVVSAALSLGSEGPGRNFVPPLPEVLWATRALNPGDSATLEFTAPQAEGVYPYVCTFPGHGFVMYGAMYVTRAALPPLASDPHLPPTPAVVPGRARSGLLRVTDRPLVSRTFLPDCGPAAIAVGLPGGQSYCFDAGPCRVRYVWKGGFVDNTDQWEGKGDLWSQVVGRIYYRAPAGPWLRIGSPVGQARPHWEGYQLVDGYPQFSYTLDGVEVRELIRPVRNGSGLTLAYEIPSSPGPVSFVPGEGGGARFSASTGEWRAGALVLSAAEAKHFTVTLTEAPGVEPLRYWSMNDALWSSEKAPPAGVIGGAYRPGGGENPPRTLGSQVSPAQLAHGATLMAWVRRDALAPATAAAEAVGAKRGAELAAIFSCTPDWIAADPVADDRWHHLAWVWDGKGKGTLYVDGADRGDAGLALPQGQSELTIGSAGDHFLAGLLDEVRIYDRALPPAELKASFRREAHAGGLSLP